jgi:hypothetical protein
LSTSTDAHDATADAIKMVLESITEQCTKKVRSIVAWLWIIDALTK